MHGRPFNVSVEMAQTVIAIADFGSFSKAGTVVGLSQPAVSSQIKRLQTLVGGDIFRKSAAGTIPTSLGILVVAQARLLVGANDQIIGLGGGSGLAPTIVRVGVSPLLIGTLLQLLPEPMLSSMTIHCEESPRIAKYLLDGALDIAWMYDAQGRDTALTDLIRHKFSESFVWIKSPGFVLSPGSPIPLLSCPGLMTDDAMIRALSKQGLPYRLVFNGSDLTAKLDAARAGLGLTIVPKRLRLEGLILAKDHYLPPIPAVDVLLCARLEGSFCETVLNAVKMSALGSEMRNIEM